nr:metallophosphoesterase [Parabacteroides goldsteinii]
MNKLYLILLLVTFFVTNMLAESRENEGGNSPIFTVAIISDLHNQQELISGNVENVRLRGTVINTLEKIKSEENIDLLVMNGDYTSDASISEENWKKVRELMHTASLGAFQDNAKKKPVLYINGNHDYEVGKDVWQGEGSANFNAGDYYSFPMKTNVGELSKNDCFYEKTADGKYDLLAAFHYVINGFDFVCLNTGKFLYKSAIDYQYSIESVTWCKNKLEEICKDDPNKTIFFMAHFPFPDSKSIHSHGNKGLKLVESTALLKSTLAKYKNLIYIYGHDHGGDNAYIRTETAQRVTEYDSNGNWYVEAGQNESGTLFCIKDICDKYLGYGDSNLNLLENENICTISTSSVNGLFNIKVNDGVNPNLYFSTGSKTFSVNREAKNLFLYEIVSIDNGESEAVQASSVEDGKQYLIVFKDNEDYYALTNETNGINGADRRLKSVSISVNGTEAIYSDTNPDDNHSAIWSVSSKERGTKSFCSSFAGSMRYYGSSIDEYASIRNSRLIQTLLIYVYADRVVLQMKNYGETGLLNGITIAEVPTPFISERTVSNTGIKYEFSVASGNEEEGTVVSSPETGNLKENTKITVTAKAREGFIFEKWTDSQGNLLSTENPHTFSLTGDTAFYAKFKKVEIPQPVYYDFVLIPPTEIAGSVSSQPGPGRLEKQTKISVTATPNSGFVFEKWVNGNNMTLSTQNPYRFSLTGDMIIYAVFRENQNPGPVYYDFAVIPPTETVGSVVSEPRAGRLTEQTTITVTAIPEDGFVFEKWTNGLNRFLSTQNPYTFNLDETNTVVYANFKSSEIGTGVEAIRVESPTVYTRDNMLYVENICAGSKIVVMDLSGRTVSVNESKDDYIRIPLAEKQIYIVKVTHLKTDWIFKVIG